MHVASVLLIDYYQRGLFRDLIDQRQWGRFETRLEANVVQAMDLLEQYGATATFFCLGWLAERFPELIAQIAARGHEVASAGYAVEPVGRRSPEWFRDDLARARQALQAAGANNIVGYRCAYRWITRRDLWALRVLAEEGYRYDASYRPRLLGGDAHYRRSFCRQTTGGAIDELPASTTSLLGMRIPVGGGNYLRQLPPWFLLSAFERWRRTDGSPFVLYFHPWELDDAQPRITAVGPLRRVRQYRNLGRLRWLLPRYLERDRFVSAARYLGIQLSPAAPAGTGRPGDARSAAGSPAAVSAVTGRAAAPVTVIIPCHNEADALSYLERSLDELVAATAGRYAFHFLFVDDCSTDDTAPRLAAVARRRADCTLLRHDRNRGVAGAIASGCRAAQTELLASMDADCSYDPLEIPNMLARLHDEVAMVTASPYHPDGEVAGVPGWRLFLSRGLSRLYHPLLTNKLHTYTACFRAYRRSAVAGLQLAHGDYRGIVELAARLDRGGARIAEHPCRLQRRIFGRSKMHTVEAVRGHLGLLWRVLHMPQVPPAPSTSSTSATAPRDEEQPAPVIPRSRTCT